MGRHFVGDRPPPAVIPVSAVAIHAVTVPVVLAELLGDGGAVGLVVVHHALQVVALGAGVYRFDEVDVANFILSVP
jgi:hypothetical protein